MEKDNYLEEDNENEFIPYQGVHYYYDRSTNIVSNNEYEQIGVWNIKNQTIEWYNPNFEIQHKEHPDYNL